MDKEDAASPTVSTEAILLTAVINALETRDVATVDIPNVFIQTPVTEDKDGDRITMKLQGPLVDMLMQVNQTLYPGRVVEEKKGGKTLYCM